MTANDHQPPRPDAVRAKAFTVLAVVIALLTLWNLVIRQDIAANVRIWANAGLALVLLGLATAAGLRLADLGLARRDLRRGATWGGGVFVVIAVVLVIGARFPGVGGFFQTSNTSIGVARL